MDKDDPFNRPANPAGGENDFDDDARYDDAITPSVREEEYAAGQEEWDQPIDELAEDDQHEAIPQPKKDPFAADDEGPLEDDYSEHTHEAHEHDGEHDHDGGHEHEHEGEHEHEHDPEVDGPEMQAPPRAAAKAPSSIMKYVPIVGGGIAAIVIAFFGYQMFAGGSSSTPTQPSLENQNTWDLQPTQQAPTQHAANEFQQQAPTPAQPDLTANNTQPAPASSGSNVITPVATPVEQPQQQQPQQAPLPVATAPNPLESRVAELTAQLEQMKHTQDDLTQKLQAAQQAVQQAPTADENSKAATAALNNRIAELEQKLATASVGAQTTSTTTTTSTVDAPVSKAAARKAAREAARAARQAAADAAPAETTTRKSKHATSTDFVAAKKSKAAARRRKAAEQREANADAGGFEPVARSTFQGWILRSAQPGSAWLSQGPYSSDLRRVVPGDKVQGLGTVTSIHQIAGRWVVEGTQGAVR